MVFVAWLSFWIDPASAPARVSIGVTTLLVMTTLMSAMNATLPRVSYIRAVDTWSGCCLLFVFSALVEYAIVNYIGRQELKFNSNSTKFNLVSSGTYLLIY